jgi:hypothetical protein
MTLFPFVINFLKIKKSSHLLRFEQFTTLMILYLIGKDFCSPETQR